MISRIEIVERVQQAMMSEDQITNAVARITRGFIKDFEYNNSGGWKIELEEPVLPGYTMTDDDAIVILELIYERNDYGPFFRLDSEFLGEVYVCDDIDVNDILGSLERIWRNLDNWIEERFVRL